ncbi:phosphopantetheine-binding protein [Actinomycetes bacterium KLBMP 9797]
MSIDRGTTEAQVAAIWGELLHRVPGAVDDDFFALGGQSLTFVQFLARVQQIYGVDLPIDPLFESGVTVSAVAREIEQRQLAALDEDRLGDLLEELDGLSDEQVRELLARGEC